MERLCLVVCLAVPAAACGTNAGDAVGPAAGEAPVPDRAIVREGAWEPFSLDRGDGEPVGAADPSVIEVDGTWYLYPTTHAGGFEMWSSTDLVDWEYGGRVWEPEPGAWNDSEDLWAPDVSVDDDGVWMHYTAEEMIGVARADSPEGPFVDVLDHPLIGGGHGGVGDGVFEAGPGEGGPGTAMDQEEKAIDSHLLRDSSGELTLYLATYTDGPVIAAVPMEDPATPAASSPVVALPHQTTSWELFVREAPVVVERDGVYHLMYSAFGANVTCYAIGLATADDPLGPFVRHDDNPILHHDPAAGFFGPGHNTVVEGPGGELLTFLHSKDEEEPGYDRSLRYGFIDVGGGEVTFDPSPPGDSTSGETSCAR